MTVLLLRRDLTGDAARSQVWRDDVDRLSAGYNAGLQVRVRRLHDETMRALSGQMRRDADEDDLLSAAERTALLGILARVARAWRSERPPDQDLLATLFAQSDRATTRYVRRDIAAGVGGAGVEALLLGLPVADPKRMRADFISANVELITSIDTRYFAEIAKLIDTAYKDGTSTARLAREVAARYDVSRSRSELIARDQVGKLTGQLTGARNLELGVDSYQWLDSGDERVRRSHAALAGRIFGWDKPPPVGHPGQDFQCRCTSLAVLDAAHAAQLQQAAAVRRRETASRLARSPIVLGEISPSRRVISPRRLAEMRGAFAA